MDIIAFENGYWPTQGPDGAVPNSILDGLNVLIRGPRYAESFRGVTNTGVAAQPTMFLVGAVPGGLNRGSLIPYKGGTFWWVGTGGGNAYVNGVSKGAVSTALTVYDGAAFPAGISAPAAPLITDSGVMGKNQGSYSVKITLVRASTGAESNASPASNVLSVSGKKITVPVPTSSDGADRWGIYCSQRGFGATGPWYFYDEFDISAGAQTIEWYDGDLFPDLAPLDYDKPLAGTHCFALGDVMVVVIENGIALSPSIPGRPEAFPPDTVSYLNPAESIVGCTGRGTEGWQYLWAANSLHAAIRTPSSIAPVLPRALWTNVGIPSKNGAALVESELWCATGARGLARTTAGAEPDTSFAKPVEAYTASWTTANVVVGYSPHDNAVLFFHGTKGIAFMRGLNAWSPPLEMGGTVDACVTVGGQLKLSIGGSLWDFNSASASGSAWFLTSAFRDGGYPYHNKSLWRCIIVGDGAIAGAVLTNLSTSVQATIAASGTQNTYGRVGLWKPINVRYAKNYAVKISGSGAGQMFFGASIKGNALEESV
jgi:hypothetical protein